MSSRVGSYRVIRQLGAGGMGIVYLARRMGAGGFERDVALKVIRAAQPSQRDVSLLLREGRALAALKHRGIVQVFDLFAEGDALCLVMEYLPGINLRRLMACHGRLPWPAACFIGAEAARALEAAHSLSLPEAPRGLAHRDVSPTNIMIGSDGAVKLLDFGLARPVGAELSVSGLEGKLLYLPPEAAAGTGVGPGADVYALGVVLYELITGQPPFRAENDLALIASIMHQSVEPPAKLVEDIPPALDRLILRAVSRDQQLRPAAAELAEELEALAAGRFGPSHLAALVRGLPDSQWSPMPAGRGPRRRSLWMVSLALALLGGAGAILTLTYRTSSRSAARGEPRSQALAGPLSAPGAGPAPASRPASQPERSPASLSAGLPRASKRAAGSRLKARSRSKAGKPHKRARTKAPPDGEPINPFQ